MATIDDGTPLRPSERILARRIAQATHLLDDFVFMDCRLADHPKVDADLHWTSDAGLPVGFPHDHGVTHSGFSIMRVREQLKITIWDAEKVLGLLTLSSSDPGSFKRRHHGRACALAALMAYMALRPVRPNAIRDAHSERLGRALTWIRDELHLAQDDVAVRAGTSRIAVSRWEAGSQPPSFGPLCRWCEALGLIQSETRAIVEVVDDIPRLVAMLRDDPVLLHSLSPESFENFVAERFDRMGFDVQKTGETTLRDGGIDIIAVPKNRSVATYLMAVQAKHHRRGAKTGRGPVDRLLAWKDSLFRFGVLVTNTGFTRDALWTAALERNRGFLRLRDFEDLKRWIADNFWTPAEWREIPSKIELAPGIAVDIPKGELRNWQSIWPLDIVRTEMVSSAGTEAGPRRRDR